MTVGIINLLEIIDVEDQQTRRASGPYRPAELLLHTRHSETAAVKAGMNIGGANRLMRSCCTRGQYTACDKRTILKFYRVWVNTRPFGNKPYANCL